MQDTELTAYEQTQVERIARWKGWRPSPIRQAVGVFKWPADWLLSRAMSGERMTHMLEKLNDKVDWSGPLRLIRREAQVDDLRELRSGSLERCDRLEAHVKKVGAVEISTESLVAGVGGLITELASIPVELALMLRTVYRVARCYGYDLATEKHKTVVLAVIGVAMLENPIDRRRWCQNIWDMIHRADSDDDLTEQERLLNEEFRQELIDEVMQEVGIELMENKVEESIPILGEAAGVILDNAFIHKIEKAARCIFQEIWLRDNQRIGEIQPIEINSRLSTTALAGFNRAAYVTAYGLGFGVTVPSLLISRAGASILPEPVLEGIRTGATDAEERVTKVLDDGEPVLTKTMGAETTKVATDATV